MSSAHITIPELEERNLSTEEFFRIVYLKLYHELEYLTKLHPSKAIDNLNDYPLQLAVRIADSAYTLRNVIERDKDYVIANSIIRSIADMISTFILIYGGQDTEERLLRHYLYVMDGVKGRLTFLPEQIENNGQFRGDEFDALKSQIQSARLNYSCTVECCAKHIKGLHLYSENPQQIDCLIKHRNWKYKSIQSPKEHYSWTEMYNLIDLKNNSLYFSTLSEFVHGLSTSLLIVETDNITYEPVYLIAVSLIGKLLEMLERLYDKDLSGADDFLVRALRDEAMPERYVKRILSEAMSRGK